MEINSLKEELENKNYEIENYKEIIKQQNQ